MRSSGSVGIGGSVMERREMFTGSDMSSEALQFAQGDHALRGATDLNCCVMLNQWPLRYSKPHSRRTRILNPAAPNNTVIANCGVIAAKAPESLTERVICIVPARAAECRPISRHPHRFVTAGRGAQGGAQ
jgi:hypothetical protein